MIVKIPSPLLSYTGDAPEVMARGATVGEVLRDLDGRHAGLRFRIVDEHDRIRAHIKLFVNEDLARTLEAEVAETDTVHIICALSGG